MYIFVLIFFFSSRRRHTRWTGDWSSDVCSSDLDRICIRISNGARPEVAANLEGIVPSTFFEWQERGRRGEEPYAGFRIRSEERRVGKECRSRWAREH